MKIELKNIPVRELYEGYVNSDEDGVYGYGGRLDIRPKYQREFVYKPEQQRAVIDTVRHGYPLNVMYWVSLPEGRFEVMDGQQRTLSLCEYLAGHFPVAAGGNEKFFGNLPADEREAILAYPLMVYFCDGTESEKLAWFRTVNIAGERLTEQELLNAVYAGPFTAAAKRHFSKSNCAAYKLASRYLLGTPIRQDYLRKAIAWLAAGDVEGYMARHQHDPNADELWLYFQQVIQWVKLKFPHYRKEMKGVEWGTLYNEFHHVPLPEGDKGGVAPLPEGGQGGVASLDATKLEAEVARLMEDDDVTRKQGIYAYVLSGQEKYLSIRAFTPAMRRAAYERQKGICPRCGQHFELAAMEADHITPWSQGGKTIATNCQMLCKACNRQKSDK